ncbi:MAG: DUF4476 domain-containing protein [Cytophagaceae bacterium]|nr:DUF4476 domain-containing protein [Cytophagaceae bacterium]
MRNFWLIICLLIFPFAWSQVVNNLIVFSNEGEKFTLILNGEKQNPFPVSKVRVVDLNLVQYKVTINFENPELKQLNTTLTFYGTNNECHFSLNRKGRKHSMDYLTSTKIKPEVEEPTQPEPAPVPESTRSTSSDNSTSSAPAPDTRTSNPDNGNISIQTQNGNIGVSDQGVQVSGRGVNVKVDPQNKSTSTSVHVLGKDITINKAIKTGCKNVMSGLEFNEGLKTVQQAQGDTAKLEAANKLVQSNCLQTGQVRQLMQATSHDITKLKLARNAYDRTSDLNNFGKLEDVFKTEEGKRDFRSFLKSKN